MIALDGVCIRGFKKRKQTDKQGHIFEVPIKMILQIERGVFDKNKIYLWYLDKKTFKSRVDFQLQDESLTNEILARIKFIQNSINCKRYKNKILVEMAQGRITDKDSV